MASEATTRLKIYRGTGDGLPDELLEPLEGCVAQQLHWLQPVQQSPLTVEQAMENLNSQARHVWLGVINVDDTPIVLAASSLTDICEGDSAHIHGLSARHYRHDDVKILLRQAINAVALAALESAFNEHDCQQVWAVIPKRNAGAKGFCWRWGFERTLTTPTHYHYCLPYAGYLKQRQKMLLRVLTSI